MESDAERGVGSTENDGEKLLLWGDNGDFENAERRTPVSHKYKPTFAPWIEDVHFEDLIPMAISVTGGTTSPTSKKGKGKAKPKAFTIPLSFWGRRAE